MGRDRQPTAVAAQSSGGSQLSVLARVDLISPAPPVPPERLLSAGHELPRALKSLSKSLAEREGDRVSVWVAGG